MKFDIPAEKSRTLQYRVQLKNRLGISPYNNKILKAKQINFKIWIFVIRTFFLGRSSHFIFCKLHLQNLNKFYRLINRNLQKKSFFTERYLNLKFKKIASSTTRNLSKLQGQVPRTQTSKNAILPFLVRRTRTSYQTRTSLDFTRNIELAHSQNQVLR